MNKKIKEIPLVLRPREKFKKFGVKALTNDELLAILLGSGVEGKNVSMVAKSLIKKYSNNLVDIHYKELMKEKGIGEVKAITIEAIFELSKRLLLKDNSKRVINSYLDLLIDLEEYKNE